MTLPTGESGICKKAPAMQKTSTLIEFPLSHFLKVQEGEIIIKCP